MSAARYVVRTPKGQEISVGIGESDMLAVPMPRPAGEEEFAAAINRRFRSLKELEDAITEAGGTWTRLL
jgi:hypothetical protein